MEADFFLWNEIMFLLNRKPVNAILFHLMERNTNCAVIGEFPGVI